MKIIHCADIHLGASMRTHLNRDQAKIRQIELLATFSKMIDYAVENKVKAIIIAGDLFDTNECTPKTRDFLIANIEQASNVEFFYLCGNHDENNVIKNSEIPNNLHIFGSDWTTFTLENVKITGATLSECTENPYSKLNLDNKDFNIVVLHGQDITSSFKPAPDTVYINELKDKNIDYLALGHIHTYSSKPLDKRGVYAYSGCLEGRGWDECGKKGFVLLDIENNKFTTKFIPFAQRTLYEIEIEVGDFNSITEIISAIDEHTCDIPSKDFVRIVLTGKTNLQSKVDIALIEVKLSFKFFCFEIKDKTTFKIDTSKYLKDVSLAGEFVREVESSELNEDEKNEIIALGLKVLNGEEVDL